MTNLQTVSLTQLRRDVLTECTQDHVALGLALAFVEDEFPELPPEQARQMTLDLLREMLAAGEIQAGFPDSNGRDFHPWPFPADAVIGHIAGEWSPSRRPNIGEIAWFTTPSAAPADH